MGSQDYRVKKLIREVEENRLEVKSFFQRRQVWTDRDKEYFIDTVLKGIHFEIFCESGDRREPGVPDVARRAGKQRVTTLIDYFKGNPLNFQGGATVQKADSRAAGRLPCLQGCRSRPRPEQGSDRGDVRSHQRHRLRAEDHGKAERHVQWQIHPVFRTTFPPPVLPKDHNVFPYAYRKRMYDVTFCVILATTVLSDYYRRDERNKEFLERYNDEFPNQEKVAAEVEGRSSASSKGVG